MTGGARTSVVSVLLTDVEGSTALWQDSPELMDAAMVAHHDLVARVVADHGGLLPPDQGEGDARMAVFPTASSALAAAIAVQGGLSGPAWTPAQRLRVRMGLHAGEVLERDGNYFGETVNRCARVRGLAVGGQVLASSAVHGLIGERLPDGVSLTPRGEHVLKGLRGAELVYEVGAPGLETGFAPIAPIAPAPSELPRRLTRFVGRSDDIGRAVDALHHGPRLLTLLGPGGVGKTRLALEVAERFVGEMPVAFLDLSATSTAEEVLPALVALLRLSDLGVGPLGTAAAHLAGRRMLLLVDNVEHVLDAAADLGDLLRAAPELRILATSRSPLAVEGEHLQSVDPLDAHSLELFLDRVAALRPAITEADRAAGAEICVAVDHLPLAVELAAAQCRLLPPRALLPRLRTVLDTAKGGADRPSRQRTLRATVRWSYDGLPRAAQLLLARLSTFAGPVGFDDVEGVCGDGDVPDVWESLEALAGNSLLRVVEAPDGEPRFGMLVTIRDFAAEVLAADGETDRLRRRHTEHYARKAAESGFETVEADPGLLRRALDDLAEYALALADLGRDPDPTRELELCILLSGVWWTGGRVRDGDRHLTHAVGRADRRDRVWARAAAAQIYARTAIGPAADLAVELRRWIEGTDEAEPRNEVRISLAAYDGFGILRSEDAGDLARSVVEETRAAGGEIAGPMSVVLSVLRYVTPRELVGEAAAAVVETGNPFNAVLLGAIQGSILADLGRYAEAEPLLDAGVAGLEGFHAYHLWVRSWRAVLWRAQDRLVDCYAEVDALLAGLTGQETLYDLSPILTLHMERCLTRGDTDGALAVLARVDSTEALALGYGLPITALGARACRLAGQQSRAARLREICASHLPLDEPRPEVVTYWHEVAASAADPVVAADARERVRRMLDAVGLSMPPWERAWASGGSGRAVDEL